MKKYSINIPKAIPIPGSGLMRMRKLISKACDQKTGMRSSSSGGSGMRCNVHQGNAMNFDSYRIGA